MNGLTGKVAVVTGGSSGIGQAIAVRLGQEGANVAINYVGAPEGAEETREQIEHGLTMCIKEAERSGSRASIVAADVSDQDQVTAMFGQVLDEYGRIDILINNAGIQVPADSHEMRVEDFDRVVAVNLRGAFLCAQQAIRHWVAADTAGSIVNVSSVHQLIPKPRFLGYSVSKGGMQRLFDCNSRRHLALTLGFLTTRARTLRGAAARLRSPSGTTAPRAKGRRAAQRRRWQSWRNAAAPQLPDR